jgi:acid phosphatase
MTLCIVPGERTPVGVRLANPPASIPEHWTMCRMAYRFRTIPDMLGVSSEGLPITKALDHRVDESQNIPKLVERIDGTTAEGGW